MLKDEQVAEHLAPHKRESLKKEAFAMGNRGRQALSRFAFWRGTSPIRTAYLGRCL